MRVLISYHHKDDAFASKLLKDLKEQNIVAWFDKESLDYGKQWLAQIDDALRRYDYVLGVITESYRDSTGGFEAFAAISNGLSERKVIFLPLFFSEHLNIDSPILNSLHGFNFYKDYELELKNLIEFLNREQPEKESEILSKVEGPEFESPFRRVRTEQFKNNYQLLAKIFTEPKIAKYEIIRNNLSTIIFGGRGTGKTMVLKSLTPQVAISRLKSTKFSEAKLKGLDFFGVYLKLKRGSLANYDNNLILQLGALSTKQSLETNYDILWSEVEEDKYVQKSTNPLISSGYKVAGIIANHELNLKILNAIINELKKFSSDNILEVNSDIEKRIVGKIIKLFVVEQSYANTINTFYDLIGFMDNEIVKIGRYMQRIVLPFTDGNSMDWHSTDEEFLDKVLGIILNEVLELNNTKFYLLFDEFENLLPFQQKLVNQWIKTSENFVVKVACKFEGNYTNETLEGQEIQIGNDCYDVTLDYNLFEKDMMVNYQKLLVEMCANLLKESNYKKHDINEILETSNTPQFPIEEINSKIEEIRKNANLEFDPQKIDTYRDKLEVAAIFRLIREKQLKGDIGLQKIYSGLNEFTYLSGGIIRNFLSLLGMAFYKAQTDGQDIKNGDVISQEQQAWAAKAVSKVMLERIPVNLELGGEGERVYQFVVDIGDIFRERLLYRASETEILAFDVKDISNLKNSDNKLLKRILMYGSKESIFYKRRESSSQDPKNVTDVHPQVYVLNRIYAPALELSHRSRWERCGFFCSELSQLLKVESRRNMRKQLMNRQRLMNEPTEDISKYIYD